MCVLFAGCAGMNDDFSCTKTATDACMEMKAANNLAKSGGSLDTTLTEKKKLTIAEQSKTSNKEKAKKSPSEISTKLNQSAQEQLDPLELKAPTRTHEERHQIWIAPYKDVNDAYHHAQLIEFVTKDAEWENH